MKHGRRMAGVLLAILLLIPLVSTGVDTAGATDGEPHLNIYACNLSFSDTIYIKYAVSFDSVDEDAISLLIWAQPQSEYTFENKTTQLFAVAKETINGQSCLVFDYKELAAKQMTDVVYAAAYAKADSKEIYSSIKPYSILQYVYNKLGKTGTASNNENLKNMLTQLLAYGASAQVYFGYRTNHLATDEFYQVKTVGGTLADKCNSGLYLTGEQVSVTAPEINVEGKTFDHWENNNGVVLSYERTYAHTVADNNEVLTAVYIGASGGLEFESNGDGTACLLGMGTCADTEIVIPAKTPAGDTVTEIDNSAFSNEEITSITIPVTVTDIGRRAFQGCSLLTDVYYGGTQNQWEAVNVGSYNQPLQNATMHFAGPETITVTFNDWDGTALKVQVIEKGESATPPANPARSGYSFSGWSGSYINVTANTVVTATYMQDSDDKYTVTFYDDNGTTVLKKQEVNSGENATPPADPTKSGASFLGWNGNYVNVMKDEAVKAVYSDEKNVFVVESVSGSVGNTVTVLISVDGIVKTCGFDINVMYDPNLQLVSYDDDMDLDIVVNTDAFENGMKLNFSSASDKTKQRDIIELTFQIKNTAKTSLPISVSVNSIKEISGNNPADTTYTVVGGIVAVN